MGALHSLLLEKIFHALGAEAAQAAQDQTSLSLLFLLPSANPSFSFLSQTPHE